MRGATELLRFRLHGASPEAVFLYLDLPRMSKEAEEVGRLFLDESDRASSVDLRCVYGLPVFVEGQGTARTASIARACTEAGATRVVATTIKNQPRGAAVVEITDTEGVLTWKP